MTAALTTPEFLLRPAISASPTTFVDADGVELITTSGERILDAISGVGVTCLGYDVPGIVQRIAEQAQTLPYVHALRFESRPMQELAARVARVAPEGLNHSFFVSGGSEAVETAIKFARQLSLERGEADRWRIVGRWPSFHGNTIATLSAGWHQERRYRHQPLLLDFPHIEAPNSYRGCGHCRTDGACTLACAEELERVLLREDSRTIAAFIAEPLAGAAAGAFVPHPDYFPLVREICDRHGVLLIVDEVITGFGRTGRWFAIEHWNVRPDIVVFAKGISAGFAPLGGIVVRDELVEVFRRGSGRFEHNFTMAAHPVACAAGCAALDEIERRDLVAQVAALEKSFFAALDTLRQSSLVGDIRGKGFLAGIELVADKRAKTAFQPQQRVAERVAEYALTEGVLVYPCGGSADGVGDHVLLMPAFVMPPELFPEIAGRLRRALARLEAEIL